jgi:hypothetical protein
MNRKHVLAAAALFTTLGLVIVSSSGCGGTQYGGKPSSIPRDVESDDATSSQQQSTGASNRTAGPTGTGSTGTGTSDTGGTGTRR